MADKDDIKYFAWLHARNGAITDQWLPNVTWDEVVSFSAQHPGQYVRANAVVPRKLIDNIWVKDGRKADPPVWADILENSQL